MIREISREFLVQETQKVLDAITAPAFIQAMQRFRSLQGEERIDFARRELVPGALLARGVPLSDDMRVSSRTFEEGDPAMPRYIDVEEGYRIVNILQTERTDLLSRLRSENPKLFDELGLTTEVPAPGDPEVVGPGPMPSPGDPGVVGAWGCACGGAATACGGAGGGTDRGPDNEMDMITKPMYPEPEVPDDLGERMRQTYDELIDFVTSDDFNAVVEELYSLPPAEQPTFVKEVLLNDQALESRGVKVPEGVLIQRSSFGDRRPTLFVVKKYLPDEYQVAWENLNITFDQPHEAGKIRRDESAWRKPLPFPVQSALQALDISPEELGE